MISFEHVLETTYLKVLNFYESPQQGIEILATPCINASLTNNNVKKIPPFIYHIYLKDVMLIIGSIQVLRVITSAQLSVHKIVQAIKY